MTNYREILWLSSQGVSKRGITEISGLNLTDLCTLYHSHSSLMNNQGSILNKILAGDPHKMMIETRHSEHEPIIKEEPKIKIKPFISCGGSEHSLV